MCVVLYWNWPLVQSKLNNFDRTEKHAHAFDNLSCFLLPVSAMCLHERHLIRWYFFLKVVPDYHICLSSPPPLSFFFQSRCLNSVIWKYQYVKSLFRYHWSSLCPSLFLDSSHSCYMNSTFALSLSRSLSLSRLISVAHFSLRTPPNLLLLFDSYTSVSQL